MPEPAQNLHRTEPNRFRQKPNRIEPNRTVALLRKAMEKRGEPEPGAGGGLVRADGHGHTAAVLRTLRGRNATAYPQPRAPPQEAPEGKAAMDTHRHGTQPRRDAQPTGAPQSSPTHLGAWLVFRPAGGGQHHSRAPRPDETSITCPAQGE